MAKTTSKSKDKKSTFKKPNPKKFEVKEWEFDGEKLTGQIARPGKKAAPAINSQPDWIQDAFHAVPGSENSINHIDGSWTLNTASGVKNIEDGDILVRNENGSISIK